MQTTVVEDNTCSEKKSDEWKDHLIAKILAKEEYSEHYSDWDQTQKRHGVLDDLEHFSKFLDVARKLINEVAWETIGPEAILTLTEGNLKLHFFFRMAVLSEEVERMLERGRTALDAIVHPGCTIFSLIQRY